MSYIAAEDVAKAKEMDLLTFLRNYDPQELVHVSVDTYCTREHDSLRISNGKWCWFSQGIGGRSALDYLIKVKGYSFIQEVKTILGRAAEKPPIFYCPRERKTTELLMPKLSKTTDIVERYLTSRGVHPVIIRHCIVKTDAAAVTMLWSYIGELIFNMLILVGSVKMSDRIVREMMGL